MKRPNPGTFRYSVTIEQLAGTQDATGQELKIWQTFKTATVAILSLGGFERVMHQQLFAGLQVRMWLYYTDGITPKMRVHYQSRIFDIHSIGDPWGDRRFMELICTERVESGTPGE